MIKADEILNIIKTCIKDCRIRWTYHVTMRLRERSIVRKAILESVNSYEIIEKYPNDKYLPSFLVYAMYQEKVLHIQIAVDEKEEYITIVTAYYPTLDKWDNDLKIRKTI